MMARGSLILSEPPLRSERPPSDPLTEEVRHEIFGYPDMLDFLATFLSDGDSVYSRENPSKILGTPEKMCFTCTGTPVETCWKFWQS